jgi:hypothetical protein
VQEIHEVAMTGEDVGLGLRRQGWARRHMRRRSGRIAAGTGGRIAMHPRNKAPFSAARVPRNHFYRFYLDAMKWAALAVIVCMITRVWTREAVGLIAGLIGSVSVVARAVLQRGQRDASASRAASTASPMTGLMW